VVWQLIDNWYGLPYSLRLLVPVALDRKCGRDRYPGNDEE
jgi:hypothetical protein